ncbi:MAG: hypothetical protein JXQ83_00260 [Candidatus Glassbacteria bacterium]|nr:hypothetical protein [Candidatus Glassbacteria bacterium]
MDELATPEKLSEKKLRLWLFNPFHYVAGGKALAIGAGCIIASGLVAALSNSRLDGVIDFHSGPPVQNPAWLPVSDGFLAWVLMGVLLLIGGKVISRSRVRVLDVFGTQALARFPHLITALFALIPGARRYSQNLQVKLLASGAPLQAYPMDGFLFILTMIVAVLMTVWMVVLMYRAFAVSCNVSGGKAVGVFIAALILGEVISKVALIYLF